VHRLEMCLPLFAAIPSFDHCELVRILDIGERLVVFAAVLSPRRLD